MRQFLIATSNRQLAELIGSFHNTEMDFQFLQLKLRGESSFDEKRFDSADFLLIDMTCPSLAVRDLIDKAKSINCSIKIIILAGTLESNFLIDCFRMGASGILTVESLSRELKRCIHTLYLGERYIPARTISSVLEYIIRTPHLDEHRTFLLSSREKEHISYIAEGLNSKEIAHKLKISRKTADNYRNRIMGKLNMNSIADLVKFAIRQQIIMI